MLWVVGLAVLAGVAFIVLSIVESPLRSSHLFEDVDIALSHHLVTPSIEATQPTSPPGLLPHSLGADREGIDTAGDLVQVASSDVEGELWEIVEDEEHGQFEEIFDDDRLLDDSGGQDVRQGESASVDAIVITETKLVTVTQSRTLVQTRTLSATEIRTVTEAVTVTDCTSTRTVRVRSKQTASS